MDVNTQYALLFYFVILCCLSYLRVQFSLRIRYNTIDIVYGNIQIIKEALCLRK